MSPRQPHLDIVRWFATLCFGAALLTTPPLVSPLTAQAPATSSASSTETAKPNEGPAEGTLVVVVGAAGEAEYGEQFATWAKAWTSLAQTMPLDLVQIGPAPTVDTPQRAFLEKTLRSFTEEPAPDSEQQADGRDANSQQNTPVWLVLIGHGTYASGNAKFNLVGPDVTADELAQWINPISRPVVVVNCSSASGAFLPKLSGPNRIVVTATQSGDEYNFSRFGKYLANALSSRAADVDHDDSLSLLEAFLLASRNTSTFYQEESRLATEHALLDDNGDAAGTSADFFEGIRVTASAQDGTSIDGIAAHQLLLHRFPGATELSAEAKQSRDELESQLASLVKQKDNLRPDDYYDRLEPLLVAIARLYRDASKSSGE